MELDKRIIEGKRPLTCFDDEFAKQFIGKKGYFSHYIDDYADLKLNTVLGTLGSTGDTFHESFCCTEEPFDNYYYEFFLPAEWVREAKKKKYRPYTMEEFLQEYSIGESILKVRDKREPEYVYHYLFIGHSKSFVNLGGWTFSLQELFKHFESGDGCGPDEKWRPFGILEK